MKIIKFSAKMNLNNWSKKYWNAEYCQITNTKKKKNELQKMQNLSNFL